MDLDDETLMKNCSNARNLVFARMRADPGVINELPGSATAARRRREERQRRAAISLPEVIALPDREPADVPTTSVTAEQVESASQVGDHFLPRELQNWKKETSTVLNRKCSGNCIKFTLEGFLVGRVHVQLDLCTCEGLSMTEDITKLLCQLAREWQFDFVHLNKGFYYITEREQTVRELRGCLQENLQDKSKVTFHANSECWCP